MTVLSESYRKVRYDLRPAKQVERMMLIDALRRLSAEFPIDQYQYTGMGSVHFYDYVLLHRYLGINRLLSVELSEKIKKRVHFNKPFDLVEIHIGAIGDIVPTLSRDRQHILWLDYDNIIRNEYLHDTAEAAARLSAGSILLVTVDVEPPQDCDTTKGIQDWYRSQIAGVPNSWSIREFRRDNLPSLNVKLLLRAVGQGMMGRSDVGFLPLLNFLYRDGHAMISIGGMIATRANANSMRATSISDAVYYRGNFDLPPYQIRVPVITRKERLFLDTCMPAQRGWAPTEFEIESEDLVAYTELYRFFPVYAELLT